MQQCERELHFLVYEALFTCLFCVSHGDGMPEYGGKGRGLGEDVADLDSWLCVPHNVCEGIGLEVGGRVKD